MFKDEAGQSITVEVIDITTGLRITVDDSANITAAIDIDDVGENPTNATNPTKKTSDGFYYFPTTQAETNGEKIDLMPVSSTPNFSVQAVSLYTVERMRGTDGANTVAPDNTPMRGTDGANTVVPPSVTQFNARTILAASYALQTTLAGTPAAVWTVGTRTLTSFGTLIADIWVNATRTITGGTATADNMRGTDAAMLATNGALETTLQAVGAAVLLIPSAGDTAAAVFAYTVETGFTYLQYIRLLEALRAGDWAQSGAVATHKSPSGIIRATSVSTPAGKVITIVDLDTP